MTQTPRDVAISMANVASGESGRISGYAQSTLYMQMQLQSQPRAAETTNRISNS